MYQYMDQLDKRVTREIQEDQVSLDSLDLKDSQVCLACLDLMVTLGLQDRLDFHLRVNKEKQVYLVWMVFLVNRDKTVSKVSVVTPEAREVTRSVSLEHLVCLEYLDYLDYLVCGGTLEIQGPKVLEDTSNRVKAPLVIAVSLVHLETLEIQASLELMVFLVAKV